MGEWNILSSKEQEQCFDDQNTSNLGHKKINDKGRETPPKKMNLHINQLQAWLDAIKNLLASLSDTASDSDDNPVNPSDFIKGRKYKIQKCESEWNEYQKQLSRPSIRKLKKEVRMMYIVYVPAEIG